MKYFDDWSVVGYNGVGYEAMLKDFEIEPDVVSDDQILFAAYCYENYSGSAFVVFEKEGALHEVNGSHCSCYGLEQQWTPEKTSWEALKGRSDDIYGLPSGTMTALKELIEEGLSGKV